MIDTGIARRLDALGRITIPKEIRKSFSIKEQEKLEFYTEEDKIILKKCNDKVDIFNGSDKNLIEYEGKLVSTDTIKELSKLAGLI